MKKIFFLLPLSFGFLISLETLPNDAEINATTSFSPEFYELEKAVPFLAVLFVVNIAFTMFAWYHGKKWQEQVRANRPSLKESLNALKVAWAWLKKDPAQREEFPNIEGQQKLSSGRIAAIYLLCLLGIMLSPLAFKPFFDELVVGVACFVMTINVIIFAFSVPRIKKRIRF